jgi:inner membrane protein
MLALFITVFSTALYLAAVFEYSIDPIPWGLAILFSFMQDINLPASKAGRPLFWLLALLEKRLTHQTITHFGV